MKVLMLISMMASYIEWRRYKINIIKLKADINNRSEVGQF